MLVSRKYFILAIFIKKWKKKCFICFWTNMVSYFSAVNLICSIVTVSWNIVALIFYRIRIKKSVNWTKTLICFTDDLHLCQIVALPHSTEKMVKYLYYNCLKIHEKLYSKLMHTFRLIAIKIISQTNCIVRLFSWVSLNQYFIILQKMDSLFYFCLILWNFYFSIYTSKMEFSS